ncbi:glucosidase 2 subunit beta [Glossina fuscipes]|uniref:Glucosidase 2 subunit beta n=1 Tax=Glossina fuscipes TaxID=7396 RepID=A0A8U0WKT3_9MUSC|nr:glucosidase 2 subunit beta [Glossina fuscipes]
MKKTWIKRENIYYVPFYKQKSKMFLLGIFCLGILFFIYQLLFIYQLPNVSTPWKDLRKEDKQTQQDDGGGEFRETTKILEDTIKIIRGTRLFDYDSYKPNFEGKFRCLDGSKEIPFQYVNDDFCDCLGDGSDEPSTNACKNGRFYCKYQKRHITGRGRDIFIFSSRINDGICDCCDGSDEWEGTNCRNRCST